MNVTNELPAYQNLSQCKAPTLDPVIWDSSVNDYYNFEITVTLLNSFKMAKVDTMLRRFIKTLSLSVKIFKYMQQKNKNS